MVRKGQFRNNNDQPNQVAGQVTEQTHYKRAIDRITQALSRIGYKNDLIRSDYEYAVMSESVHGTRTIPLAAFASEPSSYRNSCIGVVTTNGLSGKANVSRHYDLGAPLIFEVSPTELSGWVVQGANNVRLLECVPHAKIDSLFRKHKAEWEPQNIFRAKALYGRRKDVQLDFFDAGYFRLLESMVKEKLKNLLRESLDKTRAAYLKLRRGEPNPKELFRLVFRFIAAKTLGDRKHRGNWESDNPEEVLQAVEEYYNTAKEKLASPLITDRHTLQTAWEVISGSLHFQNLSADDLAYVYENTLITPKTRKTYGVHSTPPAIAEYLVRKLPFEALPQEKRRVLEPCAGHGIFLISAMRHLRNLLPESMSYVQKHDYLQKRLVGIEIDPFAVEVSRLSLMLADYPNKNNWKLYNEDVFETGLLENELKKADCVLCNPPYEDFSQEARGLYENYQSVHQPLEILLRVLSKPPALLGFVLPKIFLIGSAYRDVQRKLAENYAEIELVELPKVFNYSHAVTVLLLAWGQRKSGEMVSVTCRTVTEELRHRFLTEGEVPTGRSKRISLQDPSPHDFSIWTPRLSRVWSYLSDYPRFAEIAEVHRGVEYNIPLAGKNTKNRELVFSNRPKKGFFKGIETASGSILQYFVPQTSYLRIDEEVMRGNAHKKYPWKRPKVLANAARKSQGPWRLVAVYDTEGLYVYQRLHGIWPRGGIGCSIITAILNSPISNAFLYFHEAERDNRIRTIKDIPIPELSEDASRSIAEKTEMLQKYLLTCSRVLGVCNQEKLRKALLEIDAEVLKAYDLPPALERELLDTFEGYKRPVPFLEFMGYYPKGFTAFFPLHRLISEEFEYARADKLLERLEPINDKIIHEALELAGGIDD